MKKIKIVLAMAVLVCSIGASEMSVAQEQETFTYATYFYCDVTLQERADEIVEKLDKPFFDAAVTDGSITGWGWLAHHTGGKWRRVQYHQAPSIDALLVAQEKIGDQIEAKNKAMNTEAGKICNSHDDYIWRAVAGKGTARGKFGFSVYYVCDVSRENQADALVKRVFAPLYDKLVADGKLKTWNWMEHIVGGEYRRLATITADDAKTLVEARSSLVQTFQDDPLASTLDDICGSHADYIWETKAGKP